MRLNGFALPDVVMIQTDHGWQVKARGELVEVCPWQHGLEVYLTSSEPVRRVVLRWRAKLDGAVKLLGDHWERSYGDLEWRGISPERVMPWYFLIHDGTATHGMGVKTGPNAFCHWMATRDMVSLTMDVRCGGHGVSLGGSQLHVATIVFREGIEGETPFAAAQAFCSMLCDKPLVPGFPVYGGNNWYHTFGRYTAQDLLDEGARIADLAQGEENRPFMVADAGWQEILLSGSTCSGGPWKRGNRDCPDMPGLADKLHGLGVRPGLWCRLTESSETLPTAMVMQRKFPGQEIQGDLLDISHPDVLALTGEDISRFVQWGYELIKYDFSTYDVFGRWGFQFGNDLCDDGWCFSARYKTTAMVLKDFYRTIHESAGDALLIGCNTVGHLGAGHFHLQRTGDDTSAYVWERTVRMGVNTLAFRMPQHDAFYAVDADCACITKDIPWASNRMWVDLLSRSGTPFFVSASADALGAAENRAIREAFARAAHPQPLAEPLDWLETTCPARWRMDGEETRYIWYSMEGDLGLKARI